MIALDTNNNAQSVNLLPIYNSLAFLQEEINSLSTQTGGELNTNSTYNFNATTNLTFGIYYDSLFITGPMNIPSNLSCETLILKDKPNDLEDKTINFIYADLKNNNINFNKFEQLQETSAILNLNCINYISYNTFNKIGSLEAKASAFNANKLTSITCNLNNIVDFERNNFLNCSNNIQNINRIYSNTFKNCINNFNKIRNIERNSFTFDTSTSNAATLDFNNIYSLKDNYFSTISCLNLNKITSIVSNSFLTITNLKIDMDYGIVSKPSFDSITNLSLYNYTQTTAGSWTFKRITNLNLDNVNLINCRFSTFGSLHATNMAIMSSNSITGNDCNIYKGLSLLNNNLHFTKITIDKCKMLKDCTLYCYSLTCKCDSVDNLSLTNNITNLNLKAKTVLNCNFDTKIQNLTLSGEVGNITFKGKKIDCKNARINSTFYIDLNNCSKLYFDRVYQNILDQFTTNTNTKLTMYIRDNVFQYTNGSTIPFYSSTVLPSSTTHRYHFLNLSLTSIYNTFYKTFTKQIYVKDVPYHICQNDFT